MLLQAFRVYNSTNGELAHLAVEAVLAEALQHGVTFGAARQQLADVALIHDLHDAARVQGGHAGGPAPRAQLPHSFLHQLLHLAEVTLQRLNDGSLRNSQPLLLRFCLC